MYMLLILLIWLVAPVAELVIIVVLAVKNENSKKKIQELTARLEWRRPAETENVSSNNMAPGESSNTAASHESSSNAVSEETMQEQQEAWVIPGEIESAGSGQARADGRAEPAMQAESKGHLDRTDQAAIPWFSPESSEVCPASFEAAHASSEASPASDRELSSRPGRGRETHKKAAGSCQGTAALIIGVIFVVLAGLIFATTAWYILPGFCKVIMVFGCSVLFFGASALAGKILRIEKTSQAFYILGSVFLFTTVLTAGYFGLLGPDFVLDGENRWGVLWAGSVVTELALFAGLRKFNHRYYTQACFWGMTVSMTFLMGAFKLGYAGRLNGMVYYSFLLALWDYTRKKRMEEGGVTFIPKEFSVFTALHFWVFGALMMLQAVITLADMATARMLIDTFEITPWSALSLGLTVCGVTLTALQHKNLYWKVLHSVSLAIFFQYAGFCIQIDYTYQLLIGTVLTGTWFLAEKRKNSPLCSRAGGCIFTALLGINTAILLSIAFYSCAANGNDIGVQLAASLAVILFAAVLDDWGRQYTVIRGLIPLVLFPLTVTAMEILYSAAELNVRYDRIVFAYLLAAAAWDVIKRDKFCPVLLCIGTIAQAICWLLGVIPLSFLLLLSVYLLVRSFYQEGKKKAWCVKGSCLYSLVGIVIMAGSMTENGVVQMMWVLAAFAAEYITAWIRNKENVRCLFWDATGLGVFLITMAVYYADPDLEPWNMVLCLASFAGFYVLFYNGGRIWPHLAAALAVLPLPWAAALRYDVADSQIYACTAGFVLISGILLRSYKPVIEPAGPGEHVWDSFKADWFHILIILDLIPLTMAANQEWTCVYILLTALYVLQYAALKPCRKPAFTLASALGVLAFWIQPFVHWPEIIALEIQLIPAAFFIWLAGVIWKEWEGKDEIQTVLYSLCLAYTALDAFRTGNVADALILEAVCLVIFLWANIRKYVRWMRISGIIIITVALYMTKDFWLSLSWWVYLLAAGLGLIAFAAISEMKKH